MHLLEPEELEKRRHKRAKKQKTKRRKWSVAPFMCLLLALYAAVSLLVPLPALQAQMNDLKLPATGTVKLPWPGYGQAAIGAVGYGLLAQNGEQKPLPIASVAKVITAMAVLKARPFQPGTPGETMTLTNEDLATYNKYIAEGQSVVKVEAGERLTEYQALQALLLPSANNMADVLVRWAFGSAEDYLTFVNPFVKTLGMNNTRIADASGFSPQTVSTAVDLAKLAEIAMNQPTIAEIVAQPQANLPVAGTVYNVNFQLGSAGILGIKTGNTDEAGGCYLFAAKRKLDAANSVTVVGAVMGAPNLGIAINDTLPLLDEAFKNLKVTKPVETNQVVGKLSQTGGGEVPIMVREGTSVVAWTGQTLRAEFAVQALPKRINAGDKVGDLTLYAGDMTHTMPLVAAESTASHSVLWRLRHAGGYL